MNYKLINKLTGEEHICQKMVVDGWDYYVSDEKPIPCNPANVCMAHITKLCDKCGKYQGRKVIATNNPNIDIPKVVDEVEELAEKFIGCKYEDVEDIIDQIGYDSFKRGYNKSQETHPFSEEDMINLIEWMQKPAVQIGIIDSDTILTDKQILQLWREQKHKALYYE